MKNPETIIRGIMHEAAMTSSGVEGDYEGDMARGELHAIISNAQDLLNQMGEKSELEAWVQSKITKAADYISSVRNYMQGQQHRMQSSGMHDQLVAEEKKSNEIKEACWSGYVAKGTKKKGGRTVPNCVPLEEAKSEAWQRKEGKDPEGGLNAKGVASYRKANPGSKLQTAVTTEPSKLKPGSKKAKRRKSFCSRMKGMKAKLTSAKTARDPDSRINKSLRKWNCE